MTAREIRMKEHGIKEHKKQCVIMQFQRPPKKWKPKFLIERTTHSEEELKEMKERE